MNVNANELRLGNLFIEENSGKIISVIGLEKNRIVFDGMFLEKWQAKPIEIKKEWINKANFDNDHWATKWILLKIPNPTGLNYIHELQNLYFALTKKELLFSVDSN